MYGSEILSWGTRFVHSVLILCPPTVYLCFPYVCFSLFSSTFQPALKTRARGKMVPVPDGRIRLYAHTEPLPLVKKYLSFAVGEKAVLDVATYDLLIKPLTTSAGESAPAYLIQGTSIGQLQVSQQLSP